METKKNNTAKKKATPKNKPSTKKVSKVTEKQIEIIKETAEEVIEKNNFDFEKYKDKKGEYDWRGASEEEIVDAFHNMKSDDEIFVTKELEVENGDPAVLMPKEEKVTEERVEKKEEEIKKPKNNIAKKLNQYFNYFWNGQAIDY